MLLSRSALEECTDDDLVPGDPPTSTPYDAVVVGLAPALLDYAHLNTAFRILVGENRPRDAPDPAQKSTDIGSQPHSRPPLIALHKARYLEASDHALSLGPGPFVHALEDAARTSATVVGKPTRAFFEAVLLDLQHDLKDPSYLPLDRGSGQPPHRWEGIAVIGDDIHVDLGEGAIELGLWRVLGACRPPLFFLSTRCTMHHSDHRWAVKTGKYRSGDEGRQDPLLPDQVCASFAEFVEVLLEQRKSSS